MTTTDFIMTYLSESADISLKLKKQEPAISKIITMLFEAWKDDRWVFIIGNGGSASTATHLASDLAKTINTNPQARGLKAMALVDNIPLVSALTNDWGWENLYSAQLRNFWTPKSVVIGISVHGGSGKDKSGNWSQNLLKGLQFAKDNGGLTIGLSGFDGGPMKDLVDASVVVPADSTPHTESFHVVLCHLITFRLKEMVEAHTSKNNP